MCLHEAENTFPRDRVHTNEAANAFPRGRERDYMNAIAPYAYARMSELSATMGLKNNASETTALVYSVTSVA